MTVGKSLAEMTAEIRANNIEKGWRSAEGGPGANTFGDYIALLHSEVSEALEAYRDHRLADATESTDHACPDPVDGLCMCPAKPEGVGSEFADVVIRLLDMADVFGIKPFDMDCELADVTPERIPSMLTSFGDHAAWLHGRIAAIGLKLYEDRELPYRLSVPFLLRALVAVSERHGIDLTAEVERKIAYNKTRAFQHGGRTVADGATA